MNGYSVMSLPDSKQEARVHLLLEIDHLDFPLFDTPFADDLRLQGGAQSTHFAAFCGGQVSELCFQLDRYIMTFPCRLQQVTLSLCIWVRTAVERFGDVAGQVAEARSPFRQVGVDLSRPVNIRSDLNDLAADLRANLGNAIGRGAAWQLGCQGKGLRLNSDHAAQRM